MDVDKSIRQTKKTNEYYANLVTKKKRGNEERYRSVQREGRIFIDEEIKRIEQWSGQLKFKVIEEIKKQSHRQTHGKSFVVNRNNQ